MTTTTDAKSIRYDRSTRDYRAEYEGQLVGFYGSYHAAEVALDAFVYELLQDTAIVTADNEAEQAALVSDETPLLVEPVACIECDGEGRIPSHDCCGDQAGGWAETCDACNGTGLAVDLDLPSIFRPVPAPDLLAEVDTILDSAALDDLWRTSGIEWEQRSARIRANVMARIAAPTCRNCGAGHTIQTCPEVRALLFAPVVERVLERVA